MEGKKIRILVAKPGLDGHDRGAKIVCLALRDAGMEVFYSGLHRTVDEIVVMAMQESVDVIGLSVMSGAHLPICQRLMERLKEKDLTDIYVAVGGVIPKNDVPKLEEAGAKGIFPGGTPFEDIVKSIRSWF